MGEKAPSTSKESYADSLRNRSGEYRTDGKVLDESERLRRSLGIESSSSEGAAEVKGEQKPERDLTIRPVRDGELDDSYFGDYSETSNAVEPAIGPMAHEPYTFADDEAGATGNGNNTNEGPGTGSKSETKTRVAESVSEGDVVRFRDKDGKLKEWKVVKIGNPDKYGDRGVLVRNTDGSGEEQSRFYDGLLDAMEEGPVEAPSGVTSTDETDPRTKIGKAVEKRMQELMDGGMSESDAHAQAHDEFWGADFHEGGSDDDDEGGSEIVQLPEVDPALIERLDAARSRYAELTAKSRKSYLGRFFKPDTQVGGILGKIPGMQKLVAGWNKIKASKPVQNLAEGLSSMRRFNAETELAKQQYEEAYTALAKATAAELQRVGWEEDVVRSLSLIGNIKQDQLLEDEIAFQRQDQSKSTNFFVNWWVSQKGLKGKLKKASVVIAAGAVTGLTGGLLAGATGAFIAGGAAGFGIGKHVTGRRANGIDGEGWTVATRQAAEDRAVKEAGIKAAHEVDGVGSVEDITGRTEARTDEEMMGNRKRVRTATALGAAAGKGVFRIKEALTPDHVTEKPHYRNPGHDRPDPGIDHTPTAEPANPIPRPAGPEYMPPTPGQYKYPWNWAEAQFGQGNGSTELFKLSDKIAADGNVVQWHGTGKSAWLEINGVSETDAVIRYLDVYRQGGHMVARPDGAVSILMP